MSADLEHLRAAKVVDDADLFREFAKAAGRMREHHFHWLRNHDIDLDAKLVGPSLVGVERVQFSDDAATYQPAGAGAAAVIVAAGEYDADGWHQIDELIAFEPRDPTRWATRRRAEPVLGRAELEAVRGSERPIRLWPTPLDWLRAGAVGMVILDWSAALTPVFRGVRVLADDPLARRLETELELEAAMNQTEIRIVGSAHHEHAT